MNTGDPFEVLMTHWRKPTPEMRRHRALYIALTVALFISSAILLLWAAMAHAEEIKSTASGGLAISTIDASSCWIASIANYDKAVTVDWACVHTFAERYRKGKAEGYNDALAYVMQAIHDGEAKSK